MTEPLPTRGPSSIRRISNGYGQRFAALRSIPHWNRRQLGRLRILCPVLLRRGPVLQHDQGGKSRGPVDDSSSRDMRDGTGCGLIGGKCGGLAMRVKIAYKQITLAGASSGVCNCKHLGAY